MVNDYIRSNLAILINSNTRIETALLSSLTEFAAFESREVPVPNDIAALNVRGVCFSRLSASSLSFIVTLSSSRTSVFITNCSNATNNLWNGALTYFIVP